MTVFGYLILIGIDSPSLVSIEKIHETLKTVFDHISKHLEVRQKHSSRIFSSLLGVWECDKTRSSVFDKLLTITYRQIQTLNAYGFEYRRKHVRYELTSGS